MQKMSYKNFERAYKRALKECRGVIRLGGYTGIADHRDLVNEAVSYCLKKYDFNDNDYTEARILGIIKQASVWTRIHWMRYRKNQAEMYNKTYLHSFAYDLDTYGFMGSKDDESPIFSKFDLQNNGLDLLITRINGETREEQVEGGRFRTVRIAQYAHEKEVKKVQKLIEFESRQLSKTW